MEPITYQRTPRREIRAPMSRQPRRAAQAAQERMQQPYFDPSARGSDEEESDEDGSSASGEEEFGNM